MGTAIATILIIDDSANDIRLVSEMLRDEGYRLLAARNGHEGFERAVQYRPHLILLDLHMPVIDGHATARLLAADARVMHTPIIMLTASSALTDKLDAFREGVVDYITKPFSGPELAARARVHLRRTLHPEPVHAVAAPLAGAMSLSVGSAEDRFVAKAQAILLERLHANLNLNDIAHQVGTNERRLTEAFRCQKGMSVFEFVRSERHKKACMLLLTSDLSVSAIGECCGYGSAAAFTYAFRGRCSLTPSQYRASGGLVPEIGVA